MLAGKIKHLEVAQPATIFLTCREISHNLWSKLPQNLSFNFQAFTYTVRLFLYTVQWKKGGQGSNS